MVDQNKKFLSKYEVFFKDSTFVAVITQNPKIELAWINGNLFVKAHHQWKGRLFSLLLLFFLFFSALWVISKWWLNFPVKFVGWGPHPPLFYFTSVLLLSIFSPTVVLWFDDNQKSLFFYIPLLLPFRDVTMEPNPFWSFIWIFTDLILSNLAMNM